jgi:hypothetical protein
MAGDRGRCRGSAGPDGARDAQFSTAAVELFGMGIAPHHHRRAFGDADVGLPQPHSLVVGQAVGALERTHPMRTAGWPRLMAAL